MSENTIESLLAWVPVIVILGVFSIIIKKNRRSWETKQQEVMDRQKEAVELLKEIRDLLKNKGN